MDRIRNLYHSLSRSETRYLKSYLQAFHHKGENRALRLIGYLEKAPEISNGDMAELLYGDPRSKAFIMLKSRLAERMMEVMTLSINLQNNPTVKQDPAHVAILSMHKMLGYAMVLRIRGLVDQARDVLQKCLHLAREHGNTGIEVQCLSHLCNLSSSSEEVNDLYRPAIEETLEAYRTDLMGMGVLDDYRLIGRGDQLHDDDEQADYLSVQADMLEERLASHYSLRAHMYLLLLKGQIFSLRKQYDACRDILQERIDLMDAHPGLRNKYRQGILHIQLSDLELRSLRFQAAIEQASKAREHFLPTKPNYFKASIVLLFAHLYLGELREAKEVISDLEAHQHLPQMQSVVPVVAYLEACLHYLSGDLRSALHLLSEDRTLNLDKSGWNVGQRLFELMILIELGHEDTASSRVESLRKHIAKYGTDSRSEHIFRVLYRAERSYFSFEQDDERLTSDLQMLDTLPWTAIGSEVIRFDTWLDAHQRGIPYLNILCLSSD